MLVQLPVPLPGLCPVCGFPLNGATCNRLHHNSRFEDLSPEQADGTQCAKCGATFGAFTSSVPVGISNSGSQMFMCESHTVDAS